MYNRNLYFDLGLKPKPKPKPKLLFWRYGFIFKLIKTHILPRSGKAWDFFCFVINHSFFFSDLFQISDHGQIFLDYMFEFHKFYMDLPMAISRNRALFDLLTLNRYIVISNERFLFKLKAFTFYQGIVFWIFQPSPRLDTSTFRTLVMLLEKMKKTKAKVLKLGTKAVEQVR